MKYLLINLFLIGCSSNTLEQPLVIKTTPCYVDCPHYELVIFPDYWIKWKNHSTANTYKYRLNDEHIKQLRQLLPVLSKLDWKATYGIRRARDLQQIDIQYSNYKTTIYGKQFAPKPIKNLLAWAEELIKERPK